MRVVFINIHSNWMLLRVAMNYIFKFSSATKHNYILRYLLDHPDEYQVCNYINDRGFSLLTNGNEVLIKLLNKLSVIENIVTLKKNNIKPNQVNVLKSIDHISVNDIVICYNFAGEIGFRQINDVKGFKALSMIHFHGRKEEDDVIKNANIDCYFNEVDLSKSSELFRKYYHVERPWVVHPFVFAERFKKIKPFNKRLNKCFSTGTVTYKTHEEFISTYGDSCNQPSRKFVMDNQEYFKETVDCCNCDYLEDNPGKEISPNDNAIIKLYKQIYNRTHVGKQKKYFSFDMVEKFNDYKMCLVGEEILGVPGIGYVEGMACGCAYIGIDSPMYTDLGLIPGVHYIVYDGTKEGLKRAVEYYQLEKNQVELEKIANAGYEFVIRNFKWDKVAEKLLSDIKQRQQIWLSNKK